MNMDPITGITTTTTASSSTVAVTGAPSSSQQEEHIGSGLPLPTAAGVSAEGQRSILVASSATPSPVLSPPGKLFGRNANGTMVATSTPSNEAEVQLYRVLQRASLLSYYDTLLEMGGDDVQQLYEAGEEEFLEIMALVGMASKPLHVRRLQKALHEWANNPSAFQSPMPNVGYGDGGSLVYSPEPSTSQARLPISPNLNLTPLISSNVPIRPPTTPVYSPLTTSQVTSSSPQLTPVLTESQVSKIVTLAERMSKQIPQKGPRPHSGKKRTTRELEQIIAMSENDPRRMDEIRKYSAIYGRFDCKRRPEKPLTLHEVCVNEAAAQLCKLIPTLLTRRDELFPLARQLVRDAGFGHSASIARLNINQQSQKPDESSEQSSTKRARSTSAETTDFTKDILDETKLSLFAMYQKLTRPQFDCSDFSKFSSDNDEDNDSRYSSPDLVSDIDGDSMQRAGGLSYENEENISMENSNNELQHDNSGLLNPSLNSNSPLGVPIISSASGQIIAVTNPALIMSPLNENLNIKRETLSPDT